MVDLRHRSTDPEWMDGDTVPASVFAACLKDLAAVNTLTLARRPTLEFLDRAFAATPADRVLTIVDVGFGAGDMLRSMAVHALTNGRYCRFIGYDINPRSEPIARSMTPPELSIDYRIGDAFAKDDVPIDLVVSSLVTHHMLDDEIILFLRQMERFSRLGWFVNDLHRHWFAYHGFRFLSGLMRWHPFVRHDGPLSIARAFRRQDWDSLLATAETPALVKWHFPFRYCVERMHW